PRSLLPRPPHPLGPPPFPTRRSSDLASFMDKEIHDQPQAVADTLLGRLDTEGRLTLDEMRIDESVLKFIDKIVFIACGTAAYARSEEHTSELQSRFDLVCRLLLEKKK